MPEVSPSVLVIRLDAIGDALALTPALASLRGHAIPFDLVLTERNAGIFARTAARRTIVADFALRSSAPENLAAIARQAARLRENAYTHVIVATEDLGGYRLASAIGAPARVGFADPWTKPLKAIWTRRMLTHPIYRSARLQGGEHECETLFRLVAPLTGDTVPSREAPQLRPVVLDAVPPPDDRLVLQLTDKWDRLRIARNEVEALARALHAAGPLRVIAARGEAAFADSIAQGTAVPVDYFDDVDEWKTALAAAPLVVAPDSGAIHLAGMVGTPVVAVFAPQRAFDAQVARWSPWAAPYRIVRAGSGWPQRVVDAVAELRT
jgi:ADP-heptose:LPS heptosyltransferase